MKSFGLFFVIGICVLIAGIAVADDPITDAAIVFAENEELELHVSTTEGILRHRAVTPEGAMVVFVRDTANTLPWTTDLYVDDGHSNYDVFAAHQSQGGFKTCCTFVCTSNNHYDAGAGDCVSGGAGCDVCTLTCPTTAGYICNPGVRNIVISE